jgi:hypothetical protein
MEIHEVYTPFTEGVGYDDWMYKRWWCSCFVCIKMEFVALLDSVDAVMKQCGPEVTFLNDVLGGGHT